MSRFLHFTVAVEYTGRIGDDKLHKIGNEIRESLQRHADVVAVDRAFASAPAKVKHKVVSVGDMPYERDYEPIEHGWHTHDNDGACTPCSNLYHAIQQETL